MLTTTQRTQESMLLEHLLWVRVPGTGLYIVYDHLTHSFPQSYKVDHQNISENGGIWQLVTFRLLGIELRSVHPHTMMMENLSVASFQTMIQAVPCL